MIVISMSLFTCGLTSSPASFFLSWCIVNFCYASTHGAINLVIRENFEEKEWTNQLGLAAGASRVGAVGSAILFGLLLKFSQSSQFLRSQLSKYFRGNPQWRSIFLACGMFQALVALGFKLFSDNHSRNSKNRSFETMTEHFPELSTSEFLQILLKRRVFWTMLGAKSALMMVGHMMSFIPLYLANGPTAMTSTNAAMAAGTFSVRIFYYVQYIYDILIATVIPLWGMLSLIFVVNVQIFCSKRIILKRNAFIAGFFGCHNFWNKNLQRTLFQWQGRRPFHTVFHSIVIIIHTAII